MDCKCTTAINLFNRRKRSQTHSPFCQYQIQRHTQIYPMVSNIRMGIWCQKSNKNQLDTSSPCIASHCNQTQRQRDRESKMCTFKCALDILLTCMCDQCPCTTMHSSVVVSHRHHFSFRRFCEFWIWIEFFLFFIHFFESLRD